MSNASPEAIDLARRVRVFVDDHILPHELALGAYDQAAALLAAGLQAKARAAGLFGSFYPGSPITRLSDYLAVAAEEGRSEFAPAILGCDATLDTWMLDRHASPEQREAFVLKYVEELGYDEMAALTGVGVSALKMRVMRACDRLRELLKEVHNG